MPLGVIQQDEHCLAGDRVVRAVFESGLVGYVVPKPGFQQKYAVVGFRYGSLDSRFWRDDRPEPVTVPDGIAHFLEHKLFEKEDGDVFSRFARLGASANAYTGYSMTAYLFSAVNHFSEALQVLLEFVQRPYFTEASVRKEQGIIEQELRMYEDDPGRCLFVNLMQALYQVHPVRIEIGGTVDSIRRIEVDALYLCHATFYRPSNAVLAVAGDVEPQDVWRIVGPLMGVRQDGTDPGVSVRRLDPQEPEEVRSARVEKRLAVSRPRLALGIKDVPAYRSGRSLVVRDLALNIALEAAFGRASDTYRALYEDGLIDDGFGARYIVDTRFAHTVMGGETPDPERLEARLRQALEELRQRGLDPEDFERLRRRHTGELIASMDNPEMVANGLVALHFRDTSLAQYLEVLEELTLEEVNRAVAEHVAPHRMAVSVVVPGGEPARTRAGRPEQVDEG